MVRLADWSYGEFGIWLTLGVFGLMMLDAITTCFRLQTFKRTMRKVQKTGRVPEIDLDKYQKYAVQEMRDGWHPSVRKLIKRTWPWERFKDLDTFGIFHLDKPTTPGNPRVAKSRKRKQR
jgi:hypothetical protein